MRFNALLRLIAGVSHGMLTLTLRGLECASVPPKVEYELAAVGASVVKPLRALSEWALKHQPAIAVVEANSQERATLRSSRRGRVR